MKDEHIGGGAGAQAGVALAPASIETRASWVVAFAAVAILALAQGAPLTLVVGLSSIADALGEGRSLPSLATAFTSFGIGVGGVLCGWLARRVGIRAVAIAGGVVVAAGLALAARGTPWELLIGMGLGVGVFGAGALNAPIVTYVTMWFDRRRGSALALVSSGQYIAGAIWPPVFERAIAGFGWQWTMTAYGIFAGAVILPLALVLLRPPPVLPTANLLGSVAGRAKVLGMAPNAAHALIAFCSFLCCVPMAMPAAHLIAFCGDLGIRSSTGAVMLSVLLFAAFLSRQFWGAVSDRIGGLWTVFLGSLAQVAAMAAFLATTDEAGLFLVAAAYGLGFAGIIPAYVLAVRALFPVGEASWRIPVLYLVSLSGMGFGAWLAGAIYDRAGYYGAAWMAGIVFNVLQLSIVATLLYRQAVAKAPSSS